MSLPLELQAARLKLTNDRPYLSAPLWALLPVEEKGLGTLGVDQFYRLYYDPEVVKKWTVEQLCGVLYHEVCHLLRDHSTRAQGMNADRVLWNVAADAEINDDILAEKGGLPLPSKCITPKRLGEPDGLFAEEYYNRLMKNAKKITVNVPKDAAPGAGNCGSCASGQDRDGKDKGKPDGTNGGIIEAEGRLIRRKVAEDIKESISKGDVPDWMKRWAENELAPKVDWRKELAASIRRSIADIKGLVDYTYKRPSRRASVFPEFVLPGFTQPIPNVAVVVDTSGSMGSGELLGQAIAEVGGVLKALGQTGATVLSVDAAVHTCQKAFRKEQVQLVGGGGTDMGIGIKAAANLRPRPDLVVCITDGLTGWPSEPPCPRLIVVLVLDSNKHGYKVPSYAKTIDISKSVNPGA